MSSAIRNRVAAIRDGRRSNYLWDTKIAAEATGMGDNKFGEWIYRTKRKFQELYIAQPGETAAEFASWIAEAEAERQERAKTE